MLFIRFFRKLNNDETTQYLKNYESGLNDLEAMEQLHEEIPMFMGLFNTQNNDENEGEDKFISNLTTQDDEESKLLPEDTFIDNDEQLPHAKKRSLSNTKNRRRFKFSRVVRETESSSACDNREVFLPTSTTSSMAEADGEFDETNVTKPYHISMVNDFKLNHIIDEDSD